MCLVENNERQLYGIAIIDIPRIGDSHKYSCCSSHGTL